MPKGKKPPSPILRVNSGAGNSPDSSRRQSPSYSEFQDFLTRSANVTDSSRPPSLADAEHLSEHAWLLCAATSAEAKQWEACAAGTSSRKRRLTADEMSTVDDPPRTRSRLSNNNRPISRSRRHKKKRHLNSVENLDNMSEPPSPSPQVEARDTVVQRDANPVANQPAPPLVVMQPTVTPSVDVLPDETVIAETQHRYEMLLRHMQQEHMQHMQHWIYQQHIQQQQQAPAPFPLMCCVAGSHTHNCQLHTLNAQQTHANQQHNNPQVGPSAPAGSSLSGRRTQSMPVNVRQAQTDDRQHIRHSQTEPALNRYMQQHVTETQLQSYTAQLLGAPAGMPEQYRNQFFFNPFARPYPISQEAAMSNGSLLFENSESLMQIAERMALLHKPPKGLAKAELEELPVYRFQSAESGEQTACVVCMCDFQHRNMLRVLPCSHHFHQKCIDKWLKTNRTCPICRGDASNAPK